MSSESHADRDDLEQRVRELEATVDELTPEEVGRRRALRALAAGVTGAAVGGGGYVAGQGAASATPSTSDDDGDVGLPNDRVDLFASAVDLADDQKMVLGANDVFAIVYDSAADRLEIRDQVNNTVAYIPRSASGDLTGGGALSDSGTDTDGGDDYQLPNAADNIDLQGDGAIQNAESVDTDKIGSGGGITSQDITDLAGPGNVVTSNALSSDMPEPSDVSSSRSLGTWETNNTGNPILVTVVVTVGAANASDGDTIQLSGNLNDTQSTDWFDRDQVNSSGKDDGEIVSVTIPVGTGLEYMVELSTDDTGGAGIQSWYEAEMGG